MPFEILDNPHLAKSKMGTPSDGVAIGGHSIRTRSGTSARYIKIKIGGDLAANLGLQMCEHRMVLSLGNGADSGRLGVAVAAAGNFRARRTKASNIYTLTIGSAAADGLFSLDFDPFTALPERIERPADQPPMAIIPLDPAMLDIDD